METMKLENNNYNLIKDYKNGFDKTIVESLYTDYFGPYDYIFGDWSYGKVRLKGFCDNKNVLFNDINDYSKLNDYIKNKCAFDCQYFILKKVETK